MLKRTVKDSLKSIHSVFVNRQNPDCGLDFGKNHARNAFDSRVLRNNPNSHS